MPFFSYTACQKEGSKISGLVEAPTLEGASELLRRRGLFIVSVRPHREIFSSQALRSKFSRVGFGDVVNFTRQLATMVHAGLPLTDSLSILSIQAENPAMRPILAEILRQVESGSSFSKAIERFPKLFSPIYISLVRAGEAAGKLDELLIRLADNLERSREFRSAVKGAFVYPIIILIAMAIVVAIMVIFVIPKLTTIYQEFDIDLPLPTRILIGISDFSVRFWWVVIVLILGSVFLVRWGSKTSKGRQLLDKVRLMMPVFGSLKKKASLAEFTRTFGILVSAGVPVLDALSIVSGSMDNVYFSQALAKVAARVEKGSSLAEPIRQQPLFPPIVVQMVTVGEETGKLDETLMKLSRYFEVEVEHAVKGLTTALEPMILILFGIGVGFLVWSVLSPIYQLMGQFY